MKDGLRGDPKDAQEAAARAPSVRSPVVGKLLGVATAASSDTSDGATWHIAGGNLYLENVHIVGSAAAPQF